MESFCYNCAVREKIPKIIICGFFAQLVLVLLSIAILFFTSGFNGLIAVYTFIPAVALVPIIVLLSFGIPYKRYRVWTGETAMLAIAVVLNIAVLSLLLIRFVVMSYWLHLR